MKTTFQKQNIAMGRGWKVLQHSLSNLDPDNEYEIAAVEHLFQPNLFQASNGTFTVDMGFYGSYHSDRSGNYAIYLIRGDAETGEVLAKSQTRSKAEAVSYLENCMNASNRGEYSKGFGKYMAQVKDFPITQRLMNLFW